MDDHQIASIDEAGLNDALAHADRPLLIDLYADWCGPCRQIAPEVAEIARRYAGRLDVAKVNIDANQELAERYGVFSIPTLILFLGTQPASRHTGYARADTIVERLGLDHVVG